MRKDFGSKAWSYPQPVLIIGTYDEEGRPDAMNAAWGGIYDDDKFILCLSKGHKTTKNINALKAFTVSFATEKQMVACDYVGITSGNSVPDKVQKAGFTVTKSNHVNAPLFNELPMAIECELVRIDDDEHIIGRIVNVSVDESVLGADGQPDVTLLKPISFDPVRAGYLATGERVGDAFKAGRALK